MPRGLIALVLAASSAGSAAAADLRVYPADVSLTGPRASQQLLVADEADGRAVAERTAPAGFRSSARKVASVVGSGGVRPVGEGGAVVPAAVGGRTATAKVRVARAKDQAPPSFRNDVVPTLTRNGCNSGACHGALA